MTLKHLGLVAALVGALAGCAFNGHAPDGSGTIEATQVRVAPEVAGPIAELPVQEGATLKQGDLVARIDPAAYRLKLDEVRAALAEAEARLELMVAGSRDEDIRRAREQLRGARAEDEAAQADLARIKEVFEKKSVTRKQLDDAAARAEQAAAARAAAEEVLNKFISGNRVEEVRIEQAAVARAKARVAQAEKALADTAVAAPIDGVVTAKSREAGDYVAVGATLVTLSRLDEVWLSIYVPEARLASVRLGAPAYVMLDGDETRYAGQVTFISPEAEFTPRNVQTRDERAKLVYRVKITLPNPDGVFKPGMPADGYLEHSP